MLVSTRDGELMSLMLDEINKTEMQISKRNFTLSFQENGELCTSPPLAQRRLLRMGHSELTCVTLSLMMNRAQ